MTAGGAVRGGAVASEVAAAYDEAAAAWRAGPHAVYARLAGALLATSPVPLVGARVLDVGAGTGAAGAAALAAGAASVVAVDRAGGMLRRRDPGTTAVVGDAAGLPLADGAFDLAVAAMCLGHLPDPVRALREVRRVAGAVVASSFARGWAHPAKAVVDDAVVPFGYGVPRWYRQVKAACEPAVDDAAGLARLAGTAGFGSVAVRRLDVDVGVRSPAEVVAWRFGMAHLAPFLATLPVPERQAARRAAEAAVRRSGSATAPVVIPILVLSAS